MKLISLTHFIFFKCTIWGRHFILLFSSWKANYCNTIWLTCNATYHIPVFHTVWVYFKFLVSIDQSDILLRSNCFNCIVNLEILKLKPNFKHFILFFPFSWLFLAYFSVWKIPWIGYRYLFTITTFSLIHHLLIAYIILGNQTTSLKKKIPALTKLIFYWIYHRELETKNIYLLRISCTWNGIYQSLEWSVGLKIFSFCFILCLSPFFLHIMQTQCLESQQPLLNIMPKATH